MVDRKSYLLPRCITVLYLVALHQAIVKSDILLKDNCTNARQGAYKAHSVVIQRNPYNKRREKEVSSESIMLEC